MKRIIIKGLGSGLFAVLLFARSASAQMPSSCVVGTNVYYISQAGSDSNTPAQAKSKSTPWKHHPYMASFTGSGYSHNAGDCFIFRGGDTWVDSDTPITIAAGGTSSVQDYYGVDPTWYTGSAWARPILDFQSDSSPQNAINYDAGYVTWDNWEVKDMSCSGSNYINLWEYNGNHGVVITNNYVHDFQTPVPLTCSNTPVVWASGGSVTCDGLFDHNVIDGSDANKGYGTLTNSSISCGTVTHNVVHDMCSGFNVSGSRIVAYNTIYNIGPWTGANVNCQSLGVHANSIQDTNDADIHDNVLYNTAAECIAIHPQADAAWPISHVYNNVYYYTSADSAEPQNDLCASGSSSGVIYIYNNTFYCGDSGGDEGCINIGSGGGTMYIGNNHYITSTGGAEICVNESPFNNSACGTVTNWNYYSSTELAMTYSTATADGYMATQTYAFSSTSGSSPTVGLGGNETSICNLTVVLCTDTEYGSGQGSGNTSVAGRTPNARPASGAWNAGAYQFNAVSSGPPNPPTGLVATVQ